LAEGCDLSAADKCGRTVVHVLATSNLMIDSMCWNEIKSNSNYKASLHKTDSISVDTIAILHKFGEMVHYWRVT